ncbi:SDR family NAD(P)-dependent oxidoreductase [Streptomyces sp. NBC_01244]|uniref:SDR family NAD(P)-dependent oxidoreductase n=1 Tax=Streptomyces sp. NBC_01244 TaxID=2903797 RepID=UPI002E0EA914|nr:SDR family NAD(P)-dependent oxidoreductase [Streptomyces sp. NBC_01244]
MTDRDDTHGPSDEGAHEGIAVIGMSGRFPGAADLAEFWANLRDGVESVTELTDAELAAAGVPRESIADPHYVRASAKFEGVDGFDAEFFGYTAREAKIMDPQHRLFLETAWEALEHAGYDPAGCEGSVGVFGGASSSAYLTNVLANMDGGEEVRGENVGLGNELAFLASRVSYKLNLKGPSFSVQTACSSSLVALHNACQSLLDYECDLALSGGVSYKVPAGTGYSYVDGGFLSPDGRIRPFDADARGTVFGNGVGVVVLKRLADALADGDTVHAVIRGSAVNNDGSLKASFTAPSIAGQASVIAEALAAADVEAESIDYVEAHGSGTLIGDSIEVAALSRAFTGAVECGLGSVKANVGHLDAAAGMAGLLKTVLSLGHGQLPPSLNFRTANPDIDFGTGPFRVRAELTDWSRSERVRRAGVSAFGFGGTNAHVVLEEAPLPAATEGSSRDCQLLTLSAFSEPALEQATRRLAESLRRYRPALADVAFTLASGRRALPFRRTLCVADLDSAVAALESVDPAVVTIGQAPAAPPEVAFLFSGQGSQYPDMGRGLYDTEPVFRAVVDECARLLTPVTGRDLREVLFPGTPADRALLRRTRWAQPALFVLEYALTRLWQSWGVEPARMLGHSLGEWVAATVSGVFGLEEALRLVSLRGELMERCGRGAMLSVVADRAEVEGALLPGLSVAAHNGPRECVVSGAVDVVERFAEVADEKQWPVRPLEVEHGFHSELMAPVVDEFTAAVARSKRSAPGVPFVSNVTGDWITDSQAQDPAYWGRQIRAAVEFTAGVQLIAQAPDTLLLEVGPGQILTAMARRTLLDTGISRTVTASLPHKRDPRGDGETIRRTLGQLWLCGVQPDWAGYHAGERRRRVPLPTYPFQRKSYWLAPVPPADRPVHHEAGPHPLLDRVALRSNGQTVFETEFSLDRHWVLAEHRLLGEAIVPGTTYLEMARAAAASHFGQPVTELFEVDFLGPLLVTESAPCTVHTTVRDLGDGRCEFAVASHDPERDVWTPHAHGRASSVSADRPDGVDLAELRSRCALHTVDLGTAQAEHRVMEFGRRWRDSLRTVHVGVHSAIGELALPEEFQADCQDLVLHPALLDLATGFGGFAVVDSVEQVRAYQADTAFFLPVGYDSLRVHAALPATGLSLIRPHTGEQPSTETRKVDVTVFDDQGNTAVEIVGFTVKRVTDPQRTVAHLRPHTRHQGLRWMPAPSGEPIRTPGGPVLIVGEPDSMASRLGARLRSDGVGVTVAELSEEWGESADGCHHVPPTVQGFEKLLAELSDGAPSRVVFVAAPADEAPTDLASLEHRLRYGAEGMLHLFQALAARDAVPDRLCVVAPEVARVTGTEPATAPVHATLFGLAKVIGLENDGTSVLCLDVDRDADPATVAGEVLGTWSVSTVALRGGQRFVSELAPVHLQDRSLPTGAQPTGAYLVTGGFGGIGLAVAQHLSRTVPGIRLALVGRTGLGPREQWDEVAATDGLLRGRIAAVREMEANGARVRCYQGDTSDPIAMERVVRDVRADLGTIGCVLHAAGVPGDGFLVRKDTETFRRTLAPKALGAVVLDLVTADEPPQLMVNFGSTASVFGVAGQGDYTAANSFLDHFAEERCARGLATVTVTWTDWLGTGMAADHGVRRDQGFFRSVEIEDAVRSLDEILAAPCPRVIVGEINYELLAGLPAEASDRLLAGAPLVLAESVRRRLVTAQGTAKRPAAPLPGPAETASVRLSGHEDGGYTETERSLAEIWARELGLTELDVNESSTSLGGDSLVALRIAQSIQKTMRVRVSMVDLFRYVTVAELGAHIDRKTGAKAVTRVADRGPVGAPPVGHAER